MARIPDTEIERLKAEVSLMRLVEAAGIKLTKTGKEYSGLCPFHDEDTPSLKVNEEKNVWHCFGCNAGGSVIDWVMKKNGVSFRHAAELLKEGRPDMKDTPVKHSKVRVLQAPVTMEADDTKLMNQVIDYYHRCLKNAPEALEYLKGRGLDNAELIDTFRLGFANRTLGLRLPDKQRKDGVAIRARLEKLGLYRDTGHEHFNGCIVLPVMNEQGEAQEIYGRKIGRNLNRATPLHLYLPGPHKGVWNVQALQAGREIILCEALIDAMTFWCAGFRNVTASYGAGGFTPDMLDAFKKHGIERVLIAYDRDEAGDRGAAQVAETLTEAGIECWRIVFPHGMDVNEYALKVQPASKSLGLLIRKAEWVGAGKAPVRPVMEPETARLKNAVVMVSERDVSSLAAAEAAPETPAPVVLPASPVPPAPRCDLDAAVSESEVVLVFGERRWRVRGMPGNVAIGVLKVNLMVSRDNVIHVDTFDLYNARSRGIFLQGAAMELKAPEDELRGELGRVLLKLEQVQDETIQKALNTEPARPDMSDEERRAALDLLKSPDLLDRILLDFARCGLSGEETNVLTAYLAATSRKLESPLGVVVQSSSAAGKTSLMDAVLAFIPDEEKVKYSAMTGQSLFYIGEKSLKNKVLALAEEEGAQRASYALKLLQSEGELTIASTGTDPKGNLITQEYHVEGPTALITTTTAINVDEELMNRCLVLAVDEGREQTRAIHAKQRAKRTLAGLAAKHEKENILALHRNAQRLLQPLAVVNPFADRLTFLDDRTRTRRDHEKYLTLIDVIALLHQHQRPVRTIVQGEKTIVYVEVSAADVERATKLAHEVLGRSLDELPPQTRRLLALIRKMVEGRAAAATCNASDIRFTRKELREFAGISDTQSRLHLDRLLSLEYVLAHRGRQGQGFVYELLHDGSEDGAPHLSGLIDSATLTENATTTETSRGFGPHFAAPTRGGSGPVAAPARGEPFAANAPLAMLPDESAVNDTKPRTVNGNGKTGSYTRAA